VYKVLFFERTIGVTPAARAFAHVEYLTAFFTFFVVGFVVVEGVAEGIAVGVAVGVGATRVTGLIPAVTA
jgi:hypothetical protein